MHAHTHIPPTHSDSCTHQVKLSVNCIITGNYNKITPHHLKNCFFYILKLQLFLENNYYYIAANSSLFTHTLFSTFMQICVSNVTHTRLGTAYFTFQTSARPIVPPVKLLQSYSTLNLASSPASPSASLRLQHSNNASPSSSGGASGVSVFTRSRSSATSSTLTAGSDRKLGVSFVFVLIERIA